MPKFRIELELSSINDRILLTNFDSSENLNGGITFNESLSEEENDIYNLNFSIAEKINDISIEQLIAIGRPIWLYTYNPNKAIRMVISSFRVVIGPENNIFEIQAKDYASYAFTRNNAGLTLNTFQDEDFLDWLELQTPNTTTITNIAKYILQRGWLQKIENSTVSGWTPIVIGDNKIINLEVSGSNTYNALLDLSSLSNTQLKFNYENETVTFIDRESTTLDKNYTLRRDFNLQNSDVSYSGDNMSSIFYVDAAEDEFGEQTLLSEETVYNDNFLYDFSYFVDKNLISENDLTFIQSQINVELKKKNDALISASEDRNSQLGLIRQSRSQIENIAEILAAPEKFDNYAQTFLDLQSQFFRPSLGTKQVTRTDNFKVLDVFWNEVRSNFEIIFPIKFTYFGLNYTQQESNQAVTINPYGFKINIFFESASGRIPWPSQEADPKVFLEITDEGDVEFDIRLFRINSVDIQFNLSENETVFDYIYPYFTLLNEFDGESAITKELERIQKDVQTFKDFRDEDQAELTCLINNNPEAVGCEDVFFSDDPTINLQRIEFLESRIEDYKAAIGEELLDGEGEPTGAFTPGKYTLIEDTFQKYLDNYERPATPATIMSIYRKAVEDKQKFWYDLKKDRQHIFIEGYYENDFETNVVSLKAQAEAAFTDHNKPLEDFNLSYINISDIVGVNIQDISVGDFVTLKEEKLKIVTTEESKLKVSGISRVLRDKGNISLTIFRYNMINKILERIIAQSQ